MLRKKLVLRHKCRQFQRKNEAETKQHQSITNNAVKIPFHYRQNEHASCLRSTSLHILWTNRETTTDINNTNCTDQDVTLTRFAKLDISLTVHHELITY